jgi:hypothetical protein
MSIAAAAVLSSLWSFVQFALRFEEARTLSQPFYLYYLPRRTTGFMSHWMTFGGHMMLIFLLLAAFILFAPAARRRMGAAAAHHARARFDGQRGQ